MLWPAVAVLLLVISVESAVVRPDPIGQRDRATPIGGTGLLRRLCRSDRALVVAGLVTRHEMLLHSSALEPAACRAIRWATLACGDFSGRAGYLTLSPENSLTAYDVAVPVPIRWRTPRSGGRNRLFRPGGRVFSFSSRNDTPAKSASSETARASTKRGFTNRTRQFRMELTMEPVSATTAGDPQT